MQPFRMRIHILDLHHNATSFREKKIIAMVLMACSSLRYKSGCTCWFDLKRGKERGNERGIVSRVDCLSLLLSPPVIFFMKFAGQFPTQKTIQPSAVLWKKKLSNKSARQFGQKIWPYRVFATSPVDLSQATLGESGRFKSYPKQVALRYLK